MSGSESESGDEHRTTPRPAVRRPRIRRSSLAESSSSSSSDGEGGGSKQRIRRPPNKPASVPTSPNRDNNNRDDEYSLSSPTAVASMWPVIDYDSMTESQFYSMLKQKSRRTRQEEKRRADAALARVKAEREDKIERFIDITLAAAAAATTGGNLLVPGGGGVFPLVTAPAATSGGNEDSPSPSPSSIIQPRGGCNGYLYSSMLSRVYKTLEHNNPELVGGGKPKPPTLPVPKIHKLSSKSTALTNFKEMCNAMKREPNHVKDFIEKELTVSTSIDGSEQALVMMVRNMKAMQVEQLFLKYVEEFCQCGNCGSIDTSLEKNEKKLVVLKCRKCLASRTVQAAVGAQVKVGKKKPKY